MADGVTNKFRYKLLGWGLRGETIPTNFYIHLVNSTPDEDDNTLSDLTDASNYTAQSVDLNSTDWDTWTEDDANDRGVIQLKDIAFTASGGTVTATHAVLTDDNVTEGSREVYAYWGIGSQAVPDGSTLTLPDLTIRATLPA